MLRTRNSFRCYRSLLCALVLCQALAVRLQAQSFPALEGSPYGGAVNTAVQPAAAADMPFRWDVFVVGVNAFANNDIVTGSPLHALRHSDSSLSYQWKGHAITGDRKRWAFVNSEVHILNFLVNLDNYGTVGAGWNVRAAVSADRMHFDLNDSMTIKDFIEANALNRTQQGRFVTQQWMEWYATYARVLKETTYDQWKAGATLKLIRGMSAEEGSAQDVSVRQAPGSSQTFVTSAAGGYGYSDNLEEIKSERSTRDNWKSFRSGSPFSLGLDLGVAYVSKNLSPIAGIYYPASTSYDWKLEASLTDIGRLKYTYGKQSIAADGVTEPMNVQQFARLLDTTDQLSTLNDSLANYFNLHPLEGKFSVSLPTALRINADKHISGGWAMNLRMVLDASWLDLGTDYKIRTASYLMLTPRWENSWAGVYLPLYLNQYGSAMLGLGLRIGPLVAGFQDFHWLFGQPARTGGAYIGIVIRHLKPGRPDCPPVR